MFCAKRLVLPEFKGDWAVDGPRLFRSLIDHFDYLNSKDALAIADVGTWTPVVTFATPGNLSVTYSYQVGWTVQIGQLYIAGFALATSAFTHTTASGNLTVSGVPVTASSATNRDTVGSMSWGGITKAGYTEIVPYVYVGTNYINFVGSGSGVARSLVIAADVPTAGTVIINGSVAFLL